ncbi:MAG: DUF4350 domain-containing protein [Myxococcota bacterium]
MASLKRLHALWPTLVAVAGLLCVFIGERGFSGSSPARLALSAGGVIAVIVAASARTFERPPARGPSLKLRLASAHWGVVASLAFYALTLRAQPEDQTLNLIGWGGCLILACACLVPVLLLEAAVAPVAFNPSYEWARVQQAWKRGVGFGLLIPLLVSVNFLAEQHDVQGALALGAESRPSAQTLEVVSTLTVPVDIGLFFNRASDVGDRVARYLEPLEALNSHLTVRRLDHAVHREEAKANKISNNGWVTLSRGDVRQSIHLTEDDRRARRRMRSFDRDFLQKLIKVMTDQRNAYFTVGHGERPFDAESDPEGQPGVKWLAKALEKLQYVTKPLGLGQGIQDGAPPDAEIVFIMGPQRPFLESEQDALLDSLRRGARLFVALEPGSENPLPRLLEAVGLRFKPVTLANNQRYAALSRTVADRIALATIEYAPSAITKGVRAQRGLPTVYLGAGSLTTLERGEPGFKTTVAATTLEGTYEDSNANYRRDPDEAEASARALVATVTTTGTTTAEGRMVVMADVDAVADTLVQVQGNLLLLRDALIWLQRSDDPVVAVDADPDVKIVHRREEDILVFYGSTFGIPLLTLALGWFVHRRRR